MKKLTVRQQQILVIIQQAISEKGFPPSRSEIAQALGFSSVNAAEEHLQALARKGAIEIIPGVARGIRLVKTEEKVSDEKVATRDLVPVIEGTAGNTPVLTPKHIVSASFLDASLFGNRPDYFLKVRGPSMRDIGMEEGDLAAVQQTEKFRDGQVVLLRSGEEVLVRRYRRKGRSVEFHSENPGVEPIEIRRGTSGYTIEGRVLGLVRIF